MDKNDVRTDRQKMFDYVKAKQKKIRDKREYIKRLEQKENSNSNNLAMAREDLNILLIEYDGISKFCFSVFDYLPPDER